MKAFTLQSLCVFVLVFFFYPFVITAAAISKPNYKNYSFPAVITFGDSILDTGNNNYLQTVVRSNFKPYGRDFIRGKSTGRFSNGKLPSDFYVEILGIKETMPPYLDPNLTTEDLLTGVCFASAGSGYDPLTVELAAGLSVDDQLEMFEEYIGKLKKAVGEEKTSEIIAKSIIIISMGSNDVSGSYYLSPYRKYEYTIEQYTSMLIHAGSKFIKELYKLGARRIGVNGLGPLGCVPLQRTVAGGLDRDCVSIVSEGCRIYNFKLNSSLAALAKELPDSRLVYLPNYNEFDDIIQNHHHYGFEVGDGSCCGIANVEMGPLCSSFTLKVCQDASKYVFWDSYHPTEKTYRILVTEILGREIDKFV